MRIMKAPPLRKHASLSSAERGPGAPHPKTQSPGSKKCTSALPLTVSPTHLGASEATKGLYLLSTTADNLCEHWSSTGHSRPAPASQARRTARRGSVQWAPSAESSPRTRHLLVPLHAGCSSRGPPLQALLSKTADRRLLFFCQCLREENSSNLHFKTFSTYPFFINLSLSVLPLSPGPEDWRPLWGFL